MTYRPLLPDFLATRLARPAAAPSTPEHLPVSALLCPLCHTPTSLTREAVSAGAEWDCRRCGQSWTATRLAAVAAYAVWLVEHEHRRAAQA